MSIRSYPGKGGRHIFFLDHSDIVIIRQKVLSECHRSGYMVFGVSESRTDLGIKDPLLLGSALDRQMTGLPYGLKYNTVFSNASTLAFGICANHAFHDGNKRTALIATLAHLDKNGVMPSGIQHKVLADVMENVADRRVPLTAPPPSAALRKGALRGHQSMSERASDAVVVDELARFLARYSRERAKGSAHNIRYADLRRVLGAHGFVLVGPSKNSMEIMKPRQGSLWSKLVGRHRGSYVHVTTIGWPGDSRSVGHGALKLLREKLRMREEDGYDDTAFYSLEGALDPIINEYRGVLRRLRNR